MADRYDELAREWLEKLSPARICAAVVLLRRETQDGKRVGAMAWQKADEAVESLAALLRQVAEDAVSRVIPQQPREGKDD